MNTVFKLNSIKNVFITVLIGIIMLIAINIVEAQFVSSDRASVCVGDCPQLGGSDWPFLPEDTGARLGSCYGYRPMVCTQVNAQEGRCCTTYAIGRGWCTEARPLPCTKHGGLDFPAPSQTPILAIVGGTITRNDCNSSSWGCLVTIEGDDGNVHFYAHLFERSTYVDMYGRVEAGQIIGLVGTTGSSTGNHLHYEIRTPGGGTINPCCDHIDCENSNFYNPQNCNCIPSNTC
ncbi:MAG: M23 family metallopeptidase [Pseudomonadales bacterium]|jgi:hypothetical protein|nr:M23 family metallopeptidase [Pseudomonadales bacterium]